MRVFIGVLMVMMITMNNVYSTTLGEEQELLQELKSSDFMQRIGAAEFIARKITNNEMTLKGELRNVCYHMIDQWMNNQIGIDLKEDTEGHYQTAMSRLAGAIADIKFLPFFLKYEMTFPSATRTILENGDAGIEVLMNFVEIHWKNINKQNQIIGTFNNIIDKAKDQPAKLSNKGRSQIKEKAIEIVNLNKTKSAKDPETDSESMDPRRRKFVKDKALKLFGKLGDPDLIPLVKDMAENDPVFMEVDEESAKYLKLDEKPRAEYMRNNEKKILESRKKGKKVKFYPVREEAKKTLEKLTK